MSFDIIISRSHHCVRNKVFCRGKRRRWISQGENKFAFSSHLPRFMETIYEAVEFRPAANKSRRPIDFPNYLRAPLAKLHSRCLKFILFSAVHAGFILSLNSFLKPNGSEIFQGRKIIERPCVCVCVWEKRGCAQILKNDPPVSSSIKNVSLFISIKLRRRRRRWRNQLFANFFHGGASLLCTYVCMCARNNMRSCEKY